MVYLWSPEVAKDKGDRVTSDRLQWVRLVFPVGDRWYSVTQLNAPSNPVEQVSTRSYGRFGFFFQKSLKADESLTVKYRFSVERAEPPAETGKLSAEQTQKHRAAANALYREYAYGRQ